MERISRLNVICACAILLMAAQANAQQSACRCQAYPASPGQNAITIIQAPVVSCPPTTCSPMMAAPPSFCPIAPCSRLGCPTSSCAMPACSTCANATPVTRSCCAPGVVFVTPIQSGYPVAGPVQPCQFQVVQPAVPFAFQIQQANSIPNGQAVVGAPCACGSQSQPMQQTLVIDPNNGSQMRETCYQYCDRVHPTGPCNQECKKYCPSDYVDRCSCVQVQTPWGPDYMCTVSFLPQPASRNSQATPEEDKSISR